MSQPRLDPQVEKYLSELRRAVAVLPADRRKNLVEEIRGHAAEALAEGEPPEQVIATLGDPEAIVAEASPPSMPAGQLPGRDVAVMFLLVLGIAIPILSWIAAAVLAYRSPSWSTHQKWIGLLGLPALVTAVFYGPAFLSVGLPAGAGTLLITYVVVGSIMGGMGWTGAVYLYATHPARVARRRRAPAERSRLHRALGDSFTLRR